MADLFPLQVLHSQRMSEKALTPWLIIQPDGKVLAAHCDCMAGLGESCTHVAALLFMIEATYQIKSSITATQTKAYWLPPSTKKVDYDTVRNIDFSSTKTKKKTVQNSI